MTVTQFRATEYPTAPTPEPLEGTLLDLVTPTEWETNARALLSNPEGLFASYSCLTSGVKLGKLCGPQTASKFTGAQNPNWVDGLAFGAYGAVVCKLASEEEIKAGVDRAYDAAESRVVERGLLELMVANTSSATVPGQWSAATDITPAAAVAGGGVTPQVGLALLESHMGVNYAGKGILHSTRATATMLAHLGAVEFEGRSLQTKLHTPFVAGAGYDLPNTGPTGATAPAGSAWMYGTGQVVIKRLRLPSHAVLNVFGQQAASGSPNYVPGLEPNDMVGLAEGVYLVAVDCYKAAVLVKLY